MSTEPEQMRNRADELDAEANALIRNATELKQAAGCLRIDASELEAAPLYAQRVLELAALFGIPDGGQYINDAIERAVVLGAQESHTAAQDTVKRARGEAV